MHGLLTMTRSHLRVLLLTVSNGKISKASWIFTHLFPHGLWLGSREKDWVDLSSPYQALSCANSLYLSRYLPLCLMHSPFFFSYQMLKLRSIIYYNPLIVPLSFLKILSFGSFTTNKICDIFWHKMMNQICLTSQFFYIHIPHLSNKIYLHADLSPSLSPKCRRMSDYFFM